MCVMLLWASAFFACLRVRSLDEDQVPVFCMLDGMSFLTKGICADQMR